MNYELGFGIYEWMNGKKSSIVHRKIVNLCTFVLTSKNC